MNRRNVLASAVAGTALLVGAGLAYTSRPRQHPWLAVDLVIKRLQSLDADRIQTVQPWPRARTLNHLAQSVEFSMSGYPIPRSPLFQHTVGRTAFNIFQSLGYMSHNTAEEIPGEKVFAGDVELAKQRLLRSLTDFQDFQGTLHPHFAYGVLDKSEYAKAHVMHIADHLAPAERG